MCHIACSDESGIQPCEAHTFISELFLNAQKIVFTQYYCQLDYYCLWKNRVKFYIYTHKTIWLKGVDPEHSINSADRLLFAPHSPFRRARAILLQGLLVHRSNRWFSVTLQALKSTIFLFGQKKVKIKNSTCGKYLKLCSLILSWIKRDWH